jgi:signal transduction histidine kinase
MLNKSLLWKLTLAFLLVAIITAALVAVFIRVTSADRLSRLIIDQQRSDLQSSLAAYYAENGSWVGIAENWQQIVRPRSSSTAFPPPNGQAFNQGGPQSGSPTGDRRGFFGLVDAQGVVIIANNQEYPAGSTMPGQVLKTGIPVTVDGKHVGTIMTPPLPPPFNREETLFLQRTTEALLYAVAGSMALALLIGLFLARTLIRPLQALTQAAQNMAQGDLNQQVTVRTRDEIGQLGTAFNQMSAEVTRVNQQRKQMTADIAHDLRTPLTVIAGYVESMQDGVLQPTPERLALIYTEIERLQNLVGDLKMLSQVDAGELPLRPREMSPGSLLERVAAPFQHRAEQQGITLRAAVEAGLPEIQVDEDRMVQVFGNLINNAIRYTPEGGEILLKASKAASTGNGQVILSVEDNGEGIVAEELPYIFDRFHRADKSRHADSGESGLGLAIVKALVEAHGGTVKAESQYGRGTKIQISLPGI